MKTSSCYIFSSLLAVYLILSGCAAMKPEKYDYTAYLAHMPRSILVLPPTNETTEVMAPYIYISTVTRALSEKGYYVFPVAVVDAMMKENGVPTPGEMAQIPLEKIKAVIHPDAVLYVSIFQWGAKYQVIDTTTTVGIRGRLVDTDTGTILWQGQRSVVQDSDGDAYNGNLFAMMIGAIVEKVVSSISDPTRELSYRANYELFNQPDKGLLTGHRHKKFSEEQKLLKQTPKDP